MNWSQIIVLQTEALFLTWPWSDWATSWLATTNWIPALGAQCKYSILQLMGAVTLLAGVTCPVNQNKKDKTRQNKQRPSNTPLASVLYSKCTKVTVFLAIASPECRPIKVWLGKAVLKPKWWSFSFSWSVQRSQVWQDFIRWSLQVLLSCQSTGLYWAGTAKLTLSSGSINQGLVCVCMPQSNRL